MSSKRKKILISGFYGFHNAGDEAVLEGLVKSLQSAGDADITVLSSDTEYTKKHHKGINTAARYSKSALKSLMGCDIFISGGGSLLQNVTSNKSLYYYLFMLDLANLLGKKTVIYAQGIGPVNGTSHLRKAVSSIKKCDIISVRDVDSQNLLVSNGIPKERVILTKDPAFLASSDTEKAIEILEKYNLGNSNFMVLAPRPYKDNLWLEKLNEAVKIAHRELNIPVVTMPFLPSEDTKICSEIKDAVTIKDEMDWRTVKGIIAGSSLVIGQRLHSLIFAASENIPFVTLSYDPKNKSFAKPYNQEKIFEIDDLNPDELAENIIETYKNREKISAGYASISKNNSEIINNLACKIMKL